MPLMAAKKTAKPKRTGRNLNVWIDEQLAESVDLLVEKHHTYLKRVVENALKEYVSKYKNVAPFDLPDAEE